MDAEIGIRDLADESRYNVLPDIVKELYPSELGSTLEQLPEYQRLALLVSILVLVSAIESYLELGSRSSRAQFCRILLVFSRRHTYVRYVKCVL